MKAEPGTKVRITEDGGAPPLEEAQADLQKQKELLIGMMLVAQEEPA